MLGFLLRILFMALEQFILLPFELFHSTQHRLVRLVAVRMTFFGGIDEIFLFGHVVG